MTIESKRQLLVMLLRETAQQEGVAPAPIGPRLSQKEIDNLSKLARQKAKMKKRDLQARTEHLIADAERCLAMKFSADDARWRDCVQAINRQAAEINKCLAAFARESGFPESFAPSIGIDWYSRGENATASRRAELRRVMKTRYAAEQKKAELEVDRELTNYLELLTKESLTSDRAMQLLEAMQPLEALLPPIDLDQLRIPPLEEFFDRWSRPPKPIIAETLALENSDGN